MRYISIEEMKEIELNIADELDRICTEHQLSYYLAYGSLIGAVRHQGFIPWDDDMDVFMPRKDMEYLAEHFDEWKQTPYYDLVWYRNDKAVYQFPKIVDTRTRVLERFTRKDYSIGVWVDIFPLDEIPKKLKRTHHIFLRNKYLFELVLSDVNEGLSKKAIYLKRLLHPFVKKLDPKQLAKNIDNNIRNCVKNGDTHFIEMVSAKRIIPMEKSLFSPQRQPFENREYNIPTGYEKVLTLYYGDWRTPLPEEQRIAHTDAAVWLGNSEQS